MRENFNVKKLVLTSILLAIVIVLQCIGAVFKVGQFQLSFVLIPITIGAILLGPKTGFFLGFAFGLIVIITGDAAFFMSYNGFWTVVIVLLKGSVAGYLSGVVYNVLKNKSKTVGAIAASFTTTIVNTAIFALGTSLFLMDAVTDAAGSENSVKFLFLSMIGINFLIEVAITVVLAPTINRICDIGFKNFNIEE